MVSLPDAPLPAAAVRPSIGSTADETKQTWGGSVAGADGSRSGAEEQSSRAGGSIHSHAPPPTPPPGLVRPPLPTCTYTCPRALTERLDALEALCSILAAAAARSRSSGEDGDKSTNVHPTRPRHEVAGRHPSSPSPLERRNISVAAEIDRPRRQRP
jgi:hypothetical protein